MNDYAFNTSISDGFLNQTGNQPPMSVPFFWYDYTLFFAVLGMSISTGIYFGCYGNTQSTAKDYILAGKQMKPLPVAISMIATQTSSLHYLAFPADVYRYGSAFVLSNISYVVMTVAAAYIYLPVFFNLQTTTTYQYLEKRFDAKTRLFASCLFTTVYIFYLPLNIYAPCLAFSVATGVSIHIVALTVCLCCVFYTVIGGLKTVIWTDVIQFFLMAGAFLSVVIVAVRSEGGFLSVLDTARDSQRLNLLDFDPDPTKRDSFWIIVIGGTVDLLSYTTIDQGFVQKFMAIATYREVVVCLIYHGIGMVVVISVAVFTGLAMYARYADCDPVSANIVQVNDQLVPYFVKDVVHNIPGLFGLFIAGIFCAALSTYSSFLNSTAVVIYNDFVTKLFNIKTKSSWPLKVITLIVGVVCSSLVFVTEYLGDIFPLLLAISGLLAGPMLGIFTLGLLFPKANAKGAFYGGIMASIFIASIILPAKYFELHGDFSHPHKPISIENCTFLNETYKAAFKAKKDTYTSEISFIFRISFYYYSLIGATSCIIFGLIISYCTNKNDYIIDKKLLSPVVRFLLDSKRCKNNRVVKTTSDDKETELDIFLERS